MKYDIIYADPPWKYGSKGARGGKFGELPYPSMSIKELCKMSVPSNDECLLFMWVTSPFLLDAGKVAEAWGFKYIRVDSVWNKKKASNLPHGVCGPHGMTDCEMILLFGKGKYMKLYNDTKRNQYTSVDELYQSQHSKKPEIFRQRIDSKVNPELKRLEMFARRSAEGWDVFGNEVDDSINLEYKK